MVGVLDLSSPIDGEAVACDDNGVASFDLIRHQRANERIFLYAFDLIAYAWLHGTRDAAMAAFDRSAGDMRGKPRLRSLPLHRPRAPEKHASPSPIRS
jgi:hypothetical protein